MSSSNLYMLSVSHHLTTMESNENIWQLRALWNHPGEKSHIQCSPGPNPSNRSFYWFRKMYLRFTESNLSSFISHIVHIVCTNNSQGALGSFQPHTWNVMINTNCFFFLFYFIIASVEGFTHITEAKPNYGECSFRFPQFIKVHQSVIPICVNYKYVLIYTFIFYSSVVGRWIMSQPFLAKYVQQFKKEQR